MRKMKITSKEWYELKNIKENSGEIEEEMGL